MANTTSGTATFGKTFAIDDIIEEVTEAVIEEIIEALTGREVDVELGDDDDDEGRVLDMRTEDLDDEEFGIE